MARWVGRWVTSGGGLGMRGGLQSACGGFCSISSYRSVVFPGFWMDWIIGVVLMVDGFSFFCFLIFLVWY